MNLQKDVDVLAGQRVEEMAHELRKSESVNANLTTELQNATGALSTTEREVTVLKAKLQELESHLTKVDGNKGSDLKLQVCSLVKLYKRTKSFKSKLLSAIKNEMQCFTCQYEAMCFLGDGSLDLRVKSAQDFVHNFLA